MKFWSWKTQKLKFHSRHDRAEESATSKQVIEIIQLKEQKKKEWKWVLKKAWDLKDTNKQMSICIVRVSEGEERRRRNFIWWNYGRKPQIWER